MLEMILNSQWAQSVAWIAVPWLAIQAAYIAVMFLGTFILFFRGGKEERVWQVYERAKETSIFLRIVFGFACTRATTGWRSTVWPTSNFCSATPTALSAVESGRR